MATTAPSGSWRSPISAEMPARDQFVIWELTSDDDDVYWSELRPSEGSRIAVMRWRGGDTEEIAPSFNARTTVHEYGGASVAASGGLVIASRFEDQRMYRLDGPSPAPITPEPPKPRGLRYADPVVRGDEVIAVREDHTGTGGPCNTLVRLPLDGSREPIVVCEGRDFFAWPRVSPDGRQLAWIAWDHPNMPWDETQLWTADVARGVVGDPRKVAGEPGESVIQPRWSPAGELHFVGDRSGWWNIYRIAGEDRVAVAPGEREHGAPAWTFGGANYVFLDDGRVVTSWAERGLWSVGVVEENGIRRLDLGGRQAMSARMAIAGGRLWIVAGGPIEPMALLAVDVETADVEVIRRTEPPAESPQLVSRPETVDVPTSDGATAHALYYPPVNPDFRGPPEERPPLLVFSHGGPTSQTQAVFNRAVQFWTSRGFGVADVNYRGSTGFGRDFREALRGGWGVVDVSDCVAAARHLAESGRVDGRRMAIRGASAGGYVTLCALVFHDLFAAGTSYCGVADIQALMETTHKFESRYDAALLGSHPEAPRLAHDRSPIHFADRLSCPALIIQGTEDTIVTPDQAEVFVEALERNEIPHAYLLIEGEDHFLSKGDTKVMTLNAELSFYGQVFGFDPAGDVPRLPLVHGPAPAS